MKYFYSGSGFNILPSILYCGCLSHTLFVIALLGIGVFEQVCAGPASCFQFCLFLKRKLSWTCLLLFYLFLTFCHWAAHAEMLWLEEFLFHWGVCREARDLSDTHPLIIFSLQVMYTWVFWTLLTIVTFMPLLWDSGLCQESSLECWTSR